MRNFVLAAAVIALASPAWGVEPATKPTTMPSAVGQTWTNSMGMKFAYIPAGRFVMGCRVSEKGHRNYEVDPPVTISRAFLMGAFMVTRGQFATFVEEKHYTTKAEWEGWAWRYDGRSYQRANSTSWRKPGYKQADDHPVVQVCWHDAMAFCNWLSEKEGKRYRLPTEAQWEYACRAGTTTDYPWGDNPDDGKGWANCRDLTYDRAFSEKTGMLSFNWSDGFVNTSPVGTFKPNAWGLYDMIGNAQQWCMDWYGDPPHGGGVDPTGPPDGTMRVLRGSSWANDPSESRCAIRWAAFPGPRKNSNTCGTESFRLVLDLP